MDKCLLFFVLIRLDYDPEVREYIDPEVEDLNAIRTELAEKCNSYIVYAQSLIYNIDNNNKNELKGKVDLLVNGLRGMKTELGQMIRVIKISPILNIF